MTSGEDALHNSRALNFSYVLFLDLTCNVDVCEILEKFVNSGGREAIANSGRGYKFCMLGIQPQFCNTLVYHLT